MASVFTKIINGEISAEIIAEDENHIAFLDVNPIAKGHTLVIPKKEVDLIFDLESDEFKNLWSFAQTVAKKIAIAVPCVRVGVAVVGLEVPHAHIHLVPMNHIGDLNFAGDRLSFTKEEYAKITEDIRNASI